MKLSSESSYLSTRHWVDFAGLIFRPQNTEHIILINRTTFPSSIEHPIIVLKPPPDQTIPPGPNPRSSATAPQTLRRQGTIPLVHANIPSQAAWDSTIAHQDIQYQTRWFREFTRDLEISSFDRVAPVAFILHIATSCPSQSNHATEEQRRPCDCCRQDTRVHSK